MNMEKLTPEAKRPLDRYLMKRLIPTGVIAGLVGYLLNAWIYETAH